MLTPVCHVVMGLLVQSERSDPQAPVVCCCVRLSVVLLRVPAGCSGHQAAQQGEAQVALERK